MDNKSKKTMQKKIFLLLCITIALLLDHTSTPKNNTVLVPYYFGVDFHTSMKQTPRYRIKKSPLDKYWKNVKCLYDKYIRNDLEYRPEPRIPKIIHQIWLGSPFPKKYKKLQATWIKHHPDWQYKLWTDNDIEKFGLKNKQMYDTTTNYGEKSDIARYEILYRIGGLYIDTDFECLQPFDIFHHCCDFYTGLEYGPTVVAFNGLIGATPGHPILEQLVSNLRRGKRARDTAKQIKDRTGPYFFTKQIKMQLQNNNSGRCVLFPVTYFYPWPWMNKNQNSRQEIQSWFRPESFAVHHWYVSWLKKRSISIHHSWPIDYREDKHDKDNSNANIALYRSGFSKRMLRNRLEKFVYTYQKKSLMEILIQKD